MVITTSSGTITTPGNFDISWKNGFKSFKNIKKDLLAQGLPSNKVAMVASGLFEMSKGGIYINESATFYKNVLIPIYFGIRNLSMGTGILANDIDQYTLSVMKNNIIYSNIDDLITSCNFTYNTP